MLTAIIIGAGVVGASLAFRLAQIGARVTVVDRAGPAYGATGSTLAWVNSNQKTPHDYFALNLAGMRAHQALRDELGEAPWLNDGGNLFWHADPANSEELEARVTRLQGWGYPAEWIDRETVHELEPGVVLEPEVEQVAYFPQEGWVDGPLLVRRMVDLAIDRGATTRFACEVVAVEQAGGRVRGVVLADGERLAADVVVNCAGPWAGQVAALAGRNLPLRPNLGLVVRVSGAPRGTLGRVVHAPRMHMRPDGDLIMLHHGDADEPLQFGLDARVWVEELLRRGRDYVPALAGARLSRWSIATRPIPIDGRTNAGLLPSLPGYAEIVTHSGITLGALLARLVAEEITTDTVDPLLAPFRPERFG
jgi:glycine/D-amino acid oxidase-like deaminating enzyme